MALSCPLCSVRLSPSSLEAHLRLELRLPLLICSFCPQSFCSEADATGHFDGPFAKHPGIQPQLIRTPEEPAQTARLLELLRLARGGPDAAQHRLCVCGQCRLHCREDSTPASAAQIDGSDRKAVFSQSFRGREPEQVYRSAVKTQMTANYAPQNEQINRANEMEFSVQSKPSEHRQATEASEEEEPPPTDVKPNLGELKPHLAPDGKVACLQCSRREDRNSFAHHVRNYHIPGRPFQCLACPENFKRRKEIAKHHREVHGTELSDASYSDSVSKEALQDWIKLCFGEQKKLAYKTQLCRPCNVPIVVNDLKKHVAIKHIGKPLHRCKTCGHSVTTSSLSDINGHVRKVHKLSPGPATIDSSGMAQYEPIIRAMIPQIFEK